MLIFAQSLHAYYASKGLAAERSRSSTLRPAQRLRLRTRVCTSNANADVGVDTYSAAAAAAAAVLHLSGSGSVVLIKSLFFGTSAQKYFLSEPNARFHPSFLAPLLTRRLGCLLRSFVRCLPPFLSRSFVRSFPKASSPDRGSQRASEHLSCRPYPSPHPTDALGR